MIAFDGPDDPRRSCYTEVGLPKVRYPTRARAKLAIREQPLREGLQPYRCEVCDYFHLGRYPTSPAARARVRSKHRGNS